MRIEIDTDQIEQVFPVIRALGYEVSKRRFFRGLPAPWGRGVEITDQMQFTQDGTPIFPEVRS